MGEGTRSAGVDEIYVLGRGRGEKGRLPIHVIELVTVMFGVEEMKGCGWKQMSALGKWKNKERGVNMKRKRGNEKVFSSTKKFSPSEANHSVLLGELENGRAGFLNVLCNILLKFFLVLVS